MQIKAFLLDDRRIEKESYLWNMIGSILMSCQSVIMLIIVTHTIGIVEAGTFTIAYANATLFMTIGKYGMRYFQVSDVKEQFDFLEYRSARIITSIIMITASIIYINYAAINKGYTIEKSAVTFWMCLFKVVDVIEDVYHGLYQKKGRLDVAAKAMTLRFSITIIAFGIGLIIFKNMLFSLMIATTLTTILFVVFTKCTYGKFRSDKQNIDIGNIYLLLKNCFPLFAGNFLSFYIANAPRYAIDSVLNDEQQACYGFIFMPVFVIGLLNDFIFNPILYRMSVLWNNREIKKFIARIFLQLGIVVLITFICILVAFWFGIPVLSFLYNTDLSPYRTELVILLLGGGFWGLSGLLNAVITIIRYQNSLVWGYAVVAILAYIYSKRVIGQYGMKGSAILYAMLMGILCIVFLIFFIKGIIKNYYTLEDKKANLYDMR